MRPIHEASKLLQPLTKKVTEVGGINTAEIKLLFIGLFIFLAQMAYCIVAFLYTVIPDPNSHLWLLNCL